MPRLIGIFRHKYPQISIELQVHSTRQISWGVANGQIDLAVVGGELPTELNDSFTFPSYALVNPTVNELVIPKVAPTATLFDNAADPVQLPLDPVSNLKADPLGLVIVNLSLKVAPP